MKNVHNLLLVIGSLGLGFSIFGWIRTNDIATQLPFIICSSCLILGYFTERKQLQNKENV